jgi:homocitrate synthase
MSLEKFSIVDTTLREGEQFYKANFSIQDKIKIAQQLSDFGVEYIELTSPCASPKSKKDCATISGMGLKSKILTHIRCTKQDAIIAIETGVSGINFFCPSSVFHDRFGLGQQMSPTLENILEVLTLTREKAPDIEIRFSIEDVFRSRLDDLILIYNLVSQLNLINRLGVADTVGCALPKDVERVIRLLKALSKKDIEFHGHDDTGSAVANSYAALEAGATHINTSILGIGERNGVTSLAGFIARMYSLRTKLIKEKYNLEQFKQLHETVAKSVNIEIPWNHPIVGESAFIHKAGVHTNSVIRNPKSYEVIDPTDFNELRTIMMAHKLTGWNTIMDRAQTLGFTFEDDEIKKITLKIKQIADGQNIELEKVDEILIYYSKKNK